MSSRLDRITNWETRSRKAKYRVVRLAQGVRATPRHLERYFLEIFRRHPKEWMEELRLQDAHRFLRRGLTVKEIADRLGFGHVSSFCRAFRRRHGASMKSLQKARVIALPTNVAKC